MTSRFVPLRRIVALFVAIAPFVSPVASAQTPEAAPPTSAQSSAALLSPAAFARLIQSPKANPAPAAAVADSGRPGLLSQAKTVVAHEAQAAPAKAAQPKSYWERNKWGILLVTGVGVAVLVGLFMLGLGG